MGGCILNLRFLLDQGHTAPEPIVDIPLFFVPVTGQPVKYVDEHGTSRRAVVAAIIERPGGAARDVVLRLVS